MDYGRKNEEPPELITEPARIISILQNLYHQRGLISVTFPKSEYGNNRSESLIVEVNKDKKHLLLNKLESDRAHDRFLKDKIIQIKSFYSGIQVSFKAELKQLVHEDDDVYYLIALPKELYYHQKRTAHRANTSNDSPVPITIKLEDGSTLDGMIEDISIGGLSITFATNLPQSLQVGMSITSCRFTLPDDDSVTCELTVRFIQHSHEKSPPKIGARFENLPQTVHRQITQFVMALDRERIRTTIK